MSHNFPQGEQLALAGGPEDNRLLSTASETSSRFFSDLFLNNYFPEFQNRSEISRAGDQLLMGSPFAAMSEFGSKNPMLSSDLKNDLAGADRLQFSTPIDNRANGKQPDFRLVQGSDGKLRLEPAGGSRALSGGNINVEIDSGNKSLIEAIKNADKNLKEYIREMMVYWTKSHPGSPYPNWWQDILNSEPRIPNEGSPVPVEQTPKDFCPEQSPIADPPAAPQEGWQPDYRGGSGPGYGNSGGGESYYRGGGRGNSTEYSVPNELPHFDDSTNFIDRLAKTIMQNEGALNTNGSPRFDAYNADDNGGISVGLRQWHAGGALPELLNAWQEKNQDKFQEYFHGYSPAQINAMSSSEFAAHPNLVHGMKEALGDKEYQGVQSRLLTDWVKREVKMGMDHGLTSEKALAVYVDIANQYGQDSANHAAHVGLADGQNAQEMNASIRGGQYHERYDLIASRFSEKTAQLVEKTPEAGEFGHKLVNAVENWHQRMDDGVGGYCATAVQRALADVGLKQFVGSGNAWEMLGPLERSGLFVRVPESQCAPGDIILRPPSKDPGQNSIYGDISVVTSHHGNRIVQTNDLSYEFQRDNPRYDGKAVFLRYAGDMESPAHKKVAHEDRISIKHADSSGKQIEHHPVAALHNESGAEKVKSKK